MDILNLISKRRSVREYTTDEIEQEKIDYLIECARLAPSASNRQPWKFVIVKSPEKRELLQQCYHREWLTQPPVCIIALAETTQSWKRSFDGKDHGEIDVTIALEHIVLAAAEKGLGTCWICNFNINLCKELFLFPENLVPVAILPIGYPAKEPEEITNRKSTQEITETI